MSAKPAEASLRAGAYCRYSDDDADDDSESCKLQRQRCREVATAKTWTIEERHIFADDGAKGQEMKKRLDFNRCLAAVQRREFDVLIVRKLDRFARGEPLRVGTALTLMADHDVRLFEYFTGEFRRIDGAHAITAVAELHVGHAEVVNCSLRQKDKLLARDVANDGWTGLAPYGFKNQRKRQDGAIGVFMDRKHTIGVLERDEDEYPVLLLIGELFLKMGTYNAVATELNRRQIRSPGGGVWQSRTVSKILNNPTYRGEVYRGRVVTEFKAGTLTRLRAPADKVRIYPRPELQVWSSETLARIEDLIASRARSVTWSLTERKHLASSAVRCGYCGSSVSIVKGGRKKGASYCCTRSRTGTCRELGYRAEHFVDAGVIEACQGLITDVVLAETKRIVREAMAAQRQIDVRGAEIDRLARDVAASERKVKNFTKAIGEADDPGVRTHLMAVLVEERRSGADLQAALARAKAAPVASDERTVLERLDARVDDLRAGLERGGLAALPTVTDLLGKDGRLTATRRADGRWYLQGEGNLTRVFYGEDAVVNAGPKQKAQIKGTVSTTGPAVPAPAATALSVPATSK